MASQSSCVLGTSFTDFRFLRGGPCGLLETGRAGVVSTRNNARRHSLVVDFLARRVPRAESVTIIQSRSRIDNLRRSKTVRAAQGRATAQQMEGFKWGATVTQVIPATIDKVWAILADFDGIQRNFPQIFRTCETVEGEKNKPGSLRVVTVAASTPAGKILEGRDRLLTLDDLNHTTSYILEKIDLGWTGFEANISCRSVENGQTLVAWTYAVDPTSTITKEEYIRMQSGFYLEVLELTKGLVGK